jgi:acetyltransferase-like isoleucine patch superfamily enzyme
MRIELPGDGFIEANDIQLDENVKFGKNVHIKVRGTFSVGHDSYIGDRFSAVGEDIELGAFFYNGPTDSRGMVIGGGSSNFPYAKLKVGERMVCHTGHINLARPVIIGNDVGLSHDVDIITHGFWGSVLEGYPQMFSGVIIGNNVIVGWKTVIMGGIEIADNVVIGSHSTVVKSLLVDKGIYAGSPAKFIREVKEPSIEERKVLLQKICNEFTEMLSVYQEPIDRLDIQYPYVNLNKLTMNVETRTCEGTHDIITDAFRDYIRRSGIRFFINNRPFGFHLTRKPK